MDELGSDGQTDTYVLSMSFESNNKEDGQKDLFYIATFVNGKWVNAVDENFGGEKKFVPGDYKTGYGPGTYGYDQKNKTAWAVLNYNADFAIAKDMTVN
jgi:hypothetical protein